MCVGTLIFFLSKALQYVLCLCRLMYAVVREFIFMILPDISKCTNQCGPFANNVYAILRDICFTRGSKCTNHGERIVITCFLRGHLNLLFHVHFPVRVDNPVRDDLDIV